MGCVISVQMGYVKSVQVDCVISTAKITITSIKATIICCFDFAACIMMGETEKNLIKRKRVSPTRGVPPFCQ
jgi:hypothetical protein